MFDEQKLMLRWGMGDIHALRQIYDRYKDRLVTLAAALLHDKNAAEDVVHDVFARLIEKKDRLRITQNLSHYLFAAVANTARSSNSRRRPADMDFQSPQAESLPFNGASPQHPVLLKEQTDKLTQALTQLPYEQKEVVLLRHYGGLKFRAIADIQNIPLHTAQGRYRYGMEQLRSLLDGELE